VSTTIPDSLDARAQSGAMNDTSDPEPEVPERARGPRRYSAKYKAQILDEYERLDKAGKGALLRREGRYTSLISEWRKQRDRGALEVLAKPAGRQPADPRDREVAPAAPRERTPGIGDRRPCAATASTRHSPQRHRRPPARSPLHAPGTHRRGDRRVAGL
jgi:hypothetical protein